MRRFQVLLLAGAVGVVLAASYLEWAFFAYYKKWFGWSEASWSLVPLVQIGGPLCLAALMAWWLSRGPTREIRTLGQAVTRLRDGDLGAQVDVGSLSMTRPVGQALNEMASEIHALVDEQETLLQSVAHETRTPLARMRFILEKMAHANDATLWAEFTVDMDVEVAELEHVIDQVLEATRAGRGGAEERKRLSLGELLTPLVEHAAHKEIAIAVDESAMPNPAPWIEVNPFGFERAIRNLLVNACEHAQHQVRVVLTQETQWVCVAIEDDGPGIPVADRARIFKPFVRLNQDRQDQAAGRGMGLHIVARIARTYGQEVIVGESAMGGTRMETRWPVASAP